MVVIKLTLGSVSSLPKHCYRFLKVHIWPTPPLMKRMNQIGFKHTFPNLYPEKIAFTAIEGKSTGRKNPLNHLSRAKNVFFIHWRLASAFSGTAALVRSSFIKSTTRICVGYYTLYLSNSYTSHTLTHPANRYHGEPSPRIPRIQMAAHYYKTSLG